MYKTVQLNGVSRIDPSMLNGLDELDQFENWEVANALREMGYPPESFSSDPQNGIFQAIGKVVKKVVGGVKKLITRIKANRAAKKLAREQQGQVAQPVQSQVVSPQQVAAGYPAPQPYYQQQRIASPYPTVFTGGGMSPQTKQYLTYAAIAVGAILIGRQMAIAGKTKR